MRCRQRASGYELCLRRRYKNTRSGSQVRDKYETNAVHKCVTDYTTIIVVTLVAFLALAAVLLVPVYRFIQKEKEAANKWTKDEIARRAHDRPPRNGADAD